MSSLSDRSKAAAEFASTWQGRGYEKGDSQVFWLTLLRDVLGVANPENMISFENQVQLDHTSFIDAIIRPTHVMIEQNSICQGEQAPLLWKGLVSDGLHLRACRRRPGA